MRRRLDAELVRRGLVPSRARAVEVVGAGRVLVNGAPAASPARRVAPDEPVAVTGPPRRYVSRGGEKLEAGLREFGVVAQGARALDAGASTGGFTDCLLQHGAESVVAVDVGHGQLAWSLRTDSRVRVLERTNIRTLDPDAIGGPVRLAVVDLSFISLLTVAPALARCTTADAHLLLLVKPQFEAGRDSVGKGGIVRDPEVHREVVVRVATSLADVALPVTGMVRSPITGADGNREFVAHVERGANALDAIDLATVVDIAVHS